MAKYFQPGPKCGNCHFYSKKPDKYHSGRFCRLELDPKIGGSEKSFPAGNPCDDSFRSRSKTKKARKIKPWQENGISRNAREELKNGQRNRKKNN